VLGAYGSAEIYLLGLHFHQGRTCTPAAGEESETFIDKNELHYEYMRFKSKEFMTWRHFPYTAILEYVVTHCAVNYPNLVKLACVSLVLALSNAPCEAGFSLMKIIKGLHSNKMKTDTLSSRMFTKLHGPTYDDKAAVLKLCCRVATVYWTEARRNPNNAHGQAAQAVVRKTEGKRERREQAAAALVKTADENAAISASGPSVTSTNVPFSHPTYTA